MAPRVFVNVKSLQLMASSILYPPKTPAAGGRGEEAVSRDGLAALWQLYEDVALADGRRFTAEANLRSQFSLTGVSVVGVIVNCPLVAGCCTCYNSTINQGSFLNNWRHKCVFRHRLIKITHHMRTQNRIRTHLDPGCSCDSFFSFS